MPLKVIFPKWQYKAEGEAKDKAVQMTPYTSFALSSVLRVSGYPCRPPLPSEES
jgi:hypothetical protein